MMAFTRRGFTDVGKDCCEALPKGLFTELIDQAKTNVCLSCSMPWEAHH